MLGRILRLYDGQPAELAWVELSDIPVLRAIYDLWQPRVLAARRAVIDAATPLHQRRYEMRLCEEYPADEYSVTELQKPRHRGQFVLVGTFTYPNGLSVHRVSRFEPGDDPDLDKAQLALVTVQAELRAELERVRAGR
jgi:hypothetical protein